MSNQRSRVAFVFLFFLLFIESTFQQKTELLSSFAERQALLGLRSSLGLRSKDWPIKQDPCSSWNGITCRNGSVIGINISGFKRTRIGSQNPQFGVDSLSNFTNLVSFNASEFSLPGSIPDWFGQKLLTLQVLDLSSCSVIGIVPVSLGNLTGLRILNLSDNSLTGMIPASFGSLSNLSVLDISKNSLTGSIPSSFISLRNLSRLDLSSNYLTGSIPPAFGTLSRIQTLNLSNNSLASSIPPQLGDLVGLVDLDLSINSLSGSVPVDLKGLRNLQRMLIGHNLLTGSLPVDLFRGSNQLQVVVLRNNGFTGDIPKYLWSMPSLISLDVSRNNFTGLLPDSISIANISSAKLNVSQNMFYGNLTSVLRRFNVIDLSQNYFQGKVPQFVLSNASLTSNCLQNIPTQKSTGNCASFYTEKGLVFDNFGLPTGLPPVKKKSSGISHRTVVILAAVGGAIGLILIIVLLPVLIALCTRKKGASNQRGAGVGPVPTGSTPPPPPPEASINLSILGDAFTYQQLLQATGDFNDANLIKHGHSGDLFRGVLEGGIPIVIKRIDLQLFKAEVCFAELDLFSKISHQRLVPILGYCLENENQKFIVYKFMPNGDLSSSLYRKSIAEDDSLQSLDWITRLKIAIGAAEALAYLHHECSPPLVHRDVQASSILLDDKFEVRLGSLSEVTVQEGDTHQNRITRLLRFPQSSEPAASGTAAAATCPYDVYCFGKVLLELVTGKLGISASSETQLKEFLEQILPYISLYDKELVTKILDPSLIVDDDLLEEVWAMAIVAKSCLGSKPSRRPVMRHIFKALENPWKVVREENSGSARLRTTSSRGSWNAALFGSWRQSSSDVTTGIPATTSTAKGGGGGGGSGLKQFVTTDSQESGGLNGSGDHSSSRRRHSKEIYPEPTGVPQQDIEKQQQHELA